MLPQDSENAAATGAESIGKVPQDLYEFLKVNTDADAEPSLMGLIHALSENGPEGRAQPSMLSSRKDVVPCQLHMSGCEP